MNKQMEAYRTHLILEEKSEATISKYLHDVFVFLTFLSDREISKKETIQFKSYLIEKGYSVRSVNSMIASLNKYLEFIGKNDYRVKNIKTQRQLFCPEERELTYNEYERLVTTAQRLKNERLSLLIQTICGTGIRVSELKFITVESVMNGEAHVRCKSKDRKVFIVKKLRKRLIEFAKSHGIKSGSIFITKCGNPMNRSNIWREMKKLCQMARVSPDKVFPHNLRHLFARVFYNIEKDIAKLADILGHSSIDTTRIYIVTTGFEHRKRMESMKLII